MRAARLAQQFSACLWLRVWSWTPGIESCIELPAWSLLVPLSVSLPLSVCLSWIMNKIFQKKSNECIKSAFSFLHFWTKCCWMRSYSPKIWELKEKFNSLDTRVTLECCHMFRAWRFCQDLRFYSVSYKHSWMILSKGIRRSNQSQQDHSGCYIESSLKGQQMWIIKRLLKKSTEKQMMA